MFQLFLFNKIIVSKSSLGVEIIAWDSSSNAYSHININLKFETVLRVFKILLNTPGKGSQLLLLNKPLWNILKLLKRTNEKCKYTFSIC